MMKIIVSIIASLMIVNAYAEEVFPAGCKPIVVQGDLVKLSSDKPTIVMIHNLSTMDLWITHPVSDPGASAGWSSRLQTENWSALALNNKSFTLSCIESKPGHEQQVPCAGAVGICQWVGVTMPKKPTGTFWAGEDLPLSALIAHIGSRGFVLPISAQ